MVSQLLWAPKSGNSAADYEDAAACRVAGQSICRCAVADGATETSFSGEWARLLVAGYTAGRFGRGHSWPGTLAALQREWDKQVHSYGPLPWYAEEKARLGAYATLLGLTLTPASEGKPPRWSAVAIGDSCLFYTQNGRIESFPLRAAAEFHNRPALLGSIPRPGGGVRSAIRRISGTWQEGDTFYLTTDALAAWCIRCREEGAPLWSSLDELAADNVDSAAFPRWVAEQRTSGMRNDDVTLLRVHLCGG